MNIDAKQAVDYSAMSREKLEQHAESGDCNAQEEIARRDAEKAAREEARERDREHQRAVNWLKNEASPQLLAKLSNIRQVGSGKERWMQEGAPIWGHREVDGKMAMQEVARKELESRARERLSQLADHQLHEIIDGDGEIPGELTAAHSFDLDESKIEDLAEQVVKNRRRQNTLRQRQGQQPRTRSRQPALPFGLTPVQLLVVVGVLALLASSGGAGLAALAASDAVSAESEEAEETP